MKVPQITPAIEARFWARVDKSPGQGPNGDCWCWTGIIRDDRYPNNVSVAGHSFRASHVALAIDGRPRPSTEMGALHSCDHPPCIRPDHLRWGTGLDNVKDAIARWNRRGRSFSPEEVRFIRSSPSRNFELAKDFGVSQACICNIRKRVSHKHVE